MLTACVALALGGAELRELARFERSGLESGEWWRLASGHLVHLGTTHLAMNLVALWLAAMLLHDVLSTREWLATIVVAALAIDAGLYWLAPGTQWYVGLSGVLHGILAAGALQLVASRSWLGAVLLIGVILKLAWEQSFGATALSISLSSGPVVVDAHLYGALGGILSQATALGVRRLRPARL